MRDSYLCDLTHKKFMWRKQNDDVITDNVAHATLSMTSLVTGLCEGLY